MQHWLMSEGFPAQFYNWSFHRKKKEKKKGYKLVSSQDGSFMFFRTFLTSFSKSLRALCSSSKDFFIFLLSCLTETQILLILLLGGVVCFGYFFKKIFSDHTHTVNYKIWSLFSVRLLLAAQKQVTNSYSTQCNKTHQMENELFPIYT